MEIYRIYNKVNKKSYIGMTRWTFDKRYSQGKWWKYTHSPHLKRGIERYGLESFSVEILHSSAKTVDELASLEKEYIKQYNSKIPNGYNLNSGGGREGVGFVKEYELIDCCGNVYNIINLSEFCQKNKLNYAAMLNMTSGLWPHSQGFALLGSDISSIPNPNQVFYIENMETKEVFEVKKKDFSSFNKSHNLGRGFIHKLIGRNCSLTVGKIWKLKETVLPKNYYGNNPKYKNVVLMKENGDLITIKDGIYKFSKDNNLDRGQIYKLIKGKQLSYRGFRLPSSKEEFDRKKANKLGRFINLIKISSEKEIRIKNISLFCRDNSINLSNFNSMVGGRLKSYAGYKLA